MYVLQLKKSTYNNRRLFAIGRQPDVNEERLRKEQPQEHQRTRVYFPHNIESRQLRGEKRQKPSKHDNTRKQQEEKKKTTHLLACLTRNNKTKWLSFRAGNCCLLREQNASQRAKRAIQLRTPATNHFCVPHPRSPTTTARPLHAPHRDKIRATLEISRTPR